MSLLRIDEERVYALARALRELGVDGVAELESRDPQFLAIASLCSRAGVLTPLLAAINATVSYMLSGRGEDYWWEFSTRVRVVGRGLRDAVDAVAKFLQGSSYNRRFLSIKLARLRKLARCRALERFVQPLPDRSVIAELRMVLARCLGGDRDSKTVVFAAKMYYYGLRACLGYTGTLPMEIPIPVDRRVATVTAASGLVEGGAGRGFVELLTRRRAVVQRAWGLVAERSGIAPLHIDSVIWPLARFVHLDRCLITDALTQLRSVGTPPNVLKRVEILLNELCWKSRRT